MSLNRNNQGFTLIELMLAMTLFSLVMVIATAGFIGMNRVYTRGVIRKQLSESAQFVTSEVTSTLRAQGIDTQVNDCSNNGTDTNCNSLWYSQKLGQARFVWEKADSTGLYKDDKTSDQPADSGKTQILDSRYKVREFKITKLSGNTRGLFAVSGVFTTANDAALANLEDPKNIRCKGSAENSAVQTCAVEKFNFIVSARGK